MLYAFEDKIFIVIRVLILEEMIQFDFVYKVNH